MSKQSLYVVISRNPMLRLRQNQPTIAVPFDYLLIRLVIQPTRIDELILWGNSRDRLPTRY